MERLSGLDSTFLYSETPSLHMHTLKIAVLEPDAYSFERFRSAMLRTIPRLPGFRRRLVEIPWSLGHPIWIEDPDLDIDAHISRRVIPAPGDQVELCKIISEVAGTGLDRSRPLWQIVVVEGLTRGRIAVICKLHHCVADGSAAYEMLLEVALQHGDPDSPESSYEAPPKEAPPSRADLLRLALSAFLTRLAHLPLLLWKTLTGGIRVLRRMIGQKSKVPNLFVVPVTSFNKALTPNRTFATATLPLSEILEVKRQLGVTLNDVILTICGGALRQYLGQRRELPERSLVASVPTNTRQDETRRLSGNKVGNLMTTLGTNIADPIARALSIHEVLQEAKEIQAALGHDILEDWAEFAPPGPYSSISALWSRFGLASHLPPPTNMIVSNVRGPSEYLEILGGRLDEFYSVGPILEGIGLNITAWSYAGRVSFSMIACPEHVPDPWKLMACLSDALDELRQSLAERSPVP